MLYEFDQQHLQACVSTVTDDISDEQLMEGIKGRSEKALGTLYSRRATLLRTIISRVLNNDSDVDDMIQEVFVEVWNRADRYDEAKGKALGWIVTLARRRAIDRLRKKMAYNRAEERLREESKTQPDAMQPATDSEAMSADTAEIFKRVIATLPQAQQEALHLAYYRGLSQREIASQTGIPLGTIKTRLELAVRKVRTAILALGGQREWGMIHA